MGRVYLVFVVVTSSITPYIVRGQFPEAGLCFCWGLFVACTGLMSLIVTYTTASEIDFFLDRRSIPPRVLAVEEAAACCILLLKMRILVKVVVSYKATQSL